MKKENWLWAIFVGLPLRLLVLASGAFQNVVAGSFTVENEQNDSSYETVFFLPKGNNGIHYEGENIDGMLVWGPTALAVAPDGTFWIADGAANQLLRLNAN